MCVTGGYQNCLHRLLMLHITEKIPRGQREYVKEIIVTRVFGKVSNAVNMT